MKVKFAERLHAILTIEGKYQTSLDYEGSDLSGNVEMSITTDCSPVALGYILGKNNFNIADILELQIVPIEDSANNTEMYIYI